MTGGLVKRDQDTDTTEEKPREDAERGQPLEAKVRPRENTKPADRTLHLRPLSSRTVGKEVSAVSASERVCCGGPSKLRHDPVTGSEDSN